MVAVVKSNEIKVAIRPDFGYSVPLKVLGMDNCLGNLLMYEL